jgi:hypothetical protein
MEKHFTYDSFRRKVMCEEIGNRAAGRKYTVGHVYISGEV